MGKEMQQMYVLFHAQMCLDMGITTIRDMGMTSQRGLLTAEVCAVRDAINKGLFAGPRMLVAGWAIITGAHLDLVLPRNALRTEFQTADGPWELRKLVRTNLRIGADFVKTCASGGGGTDQEEPDVRNMTQEELDAIVDEAHAFHKRCAIHCFTPAAQRSAITGGADTLEHMVFTDDDAIARIKDAGVYVVPTLMHRTDHAIEKRKELGGPDFVLKKMKYLQPYCFETFEKMHAAGIRIAMGTDTSYDPEMGSSAGELALYVEHGMSHMQAIQTATRNAAEAIGLADHVGTIQTGRLADLIAVDGDPLTDIACLTKRECISLVMKDGTVVVDRRPGANLSALQVEPGSWTKA
jgi:imidazolonepropionase-like amidohydrolase